MNRNIIKQAVRNTMGRHSRPNYSGRRIKMVYGDSDFAKKMEDFRGLAYANIDLLADIKDNNIKIYDSMDNLLKEVDQSALNDDQVYALNSLRQWAKSFTEDLDGAAGSFNELKGYYKQFADFIMKNV